MWVWWLLSKSEKLKNRFNTWPYLLSNWLRNCVHNWRHEMSCQFVSLRKYFQSVLKSFTNIRSVCDKHLISLFNRYQVLTRNAIPRNCESGTYILYIFHQTFKWRHLETPLLMSLSLICIPQEILILFWINLAISLCTDFLDSQFWVSTAHRISNVWRPLIITTCKLERTNLLKNTAQNTLRMARMWIILSIKYIHHYQCCSLTRIASMQTCLFYSINNLINYVAVMFWFCLDLQKTTICGWWNHTNLHMYCKILN